MQSSLRKHVVSKRAVARETCRWSKLSAILITPFLASCLPDKSIAFSVSLQWRLLPVWYTLAVLQLCSQLLCGYATVLSRWLSCYRLYTSFSRPKLTSSSQKNDLLNIRDLAWLPGNSAAYKKSWCVLCNYRTGGLVRSHTSHAKWVWNSCFSKHEARIKEDRYFNLDSFADHSPDTNVFDFIATHPF